MFYLCWSFPNFFGVVYFAEEIDSFYDPLLFEKLIYQRVFFGLN